MTTPNQIKRLLDRLEDREGIDASRVVLVGLLKRGKAGMTKAEALKQVAQNRGETLAEVRRYFDLDSYSLGVLFHAGLVQGYGGDADLILTDGDGYEFVEAGQFVRVDEIKWDTVAVVDGETLEFLGPPDEDNLREVAESQGSRRGRRGRRNPQEAATDKATLDAYAALTARVGFGIHSSTQLLRAGADWPLLHKLTDAGLIRIERWIDTPGTDRSTPLYRLLFP